ncbi:MAG: polysaccharide deacetylase family protein [Chloroflexi bacterium]|nr:polysaccharide deacetylase family protein [Chloroflexota bacterium]
MIKRLLLFVTLFLLTLTIFTPASAQTNAPFRVYLTFEDGPTDAYTPAILDTLAQYNAHASFLIGGAAIAGHEALLQREVRAGHALINHLWVEPGVYAGAPADAVTASYLRTEAAIRDALGDALPIYDAQVKLFWQPGGSAQPLPAIEGVHVITYNWNVNSDDCGWGMPASVDLDTLDFDKAVIANVIGTPVSVGNFHSPYNAFDYGDGVVISFHDINRVTGRVLPAILGQLQAAGATFEALPRPWDQIDTMPIHIARPPEEGAGVAGYSAAAITLDAANIRTAPSTSAHRLATIPLDSSVVAVGRTQNWIQVQYAGSTGWIYRPLLHIEGAIPNLPASP